MGCAGPETHCTCVVLSLTDGDCYKHTPCSPTEQASALENDAHVGHVYVCSSALDLGSRPDFQQDVN